MSFDVNVIGCAAACVHHARSLCARRTAARETPSPGPCRVARAVCPRASPPVLALRPLRGDHETQGAKTGGSGGQIRETNLPCPASLCVSMATAQGAAPPATAADVPHAAAGQGVRIARVPLCGGAPLRVRDCAPLLIYTRTPAHAHTHTHARRTWAAAAGRCVRARIAARLAPQSAPLPASAYRRRRRRFRHAILTTDRSPARRVCGWVGSRVGPSAGSAAVDPPAWAARPVHHPGYRCVGDGACVDAHNRYGLPPGGSPGGPVRAGPTRPFACRTHAPAPCPFLPCPCSPRARRHHPGRRPPAHLPFTSALSLARLSPTTSPQQIHIYTHARAARRFLAPCRACSGAGAGALFARAALTAMPVVHATRTAKSADRHAGSRLCCSGTRCAGAFPR